jgi:hypothetical protein
MLVTLFTACYFIFAVYFFVPVLAKAWHSEIWIGRGAEYSRVNSPKMYWFGMALGVLMILLPTFVLWVLIFYGPR